MLKAVSAELDRTRFIFTFTLSSEGEESVIPKSRVWAQSVGTAGERERERGRVQEEERRKKTRGERRGEEKEEEERRKKRRGERRGGEAD